MIPNYLIFNFLHIPLNSFNLSTYDHFINMFYPLSLLMFLSLNNLIYIKRIGKEYSAIFKLNVFVHLERKKISMINNKCSHMQIKT